MPKQVKSTLIETYRQRYKRCSRGKRTLIIDEVCEMLQITRKHAIKIMNNEYWRSESLKPGPEPIYNESIEKHLVYLWKAMDNLCSKNMKEALPEWLEFYDCDEGEKSLLRKVSASTIDRILKKYRAVPKAHSATSSMLKTKIPLELLDGKITEPGFVEADTVAQCGPSLAGQFVFSLTVTDLFSGWTENRAVWGKTGENVQAAIEDVETHLPFKLRGFATDNGNEFLNNDLYTYFSDRENKDDVVHFVRRRPYKKNDNAHVEQKNWTHVRKLWGYSRIDDENFDVDYMNDVYKNYWCPLKNFFIPTMKLKEKHRLGGRTIKTYEKPKTPYQRLIESDSLSNEAKEALIYLKSSLNPFKIKQELDTKMRWFFRIQNTRKERRCA